MREKFSFPCVNAVIPALYRLH